MKLSFSTIIIMAVSVAVGILAFAILHQWMPTRQAVENYNVYRTSLETEAGKARQADNRVKKAREQVATKTRVWNSYVATRTPETSVSRGGINLNVDPYQLTVDTQKFKDSIQRAVNAQVKKGGVKVDVAPEVRGPADTDQASLLLADYYNYPGIKFPVVMFDFGTVTVRGTYAQIMANVRAYKTMPRYLAVTDGLQISGTSPNLVGTYNLSIVGFIRGKEIFPTVAAAASTAPAPGFGGPGGPGRPGMPGMPGMPGGPGKGGG